MGKLDGMTRLGGKTAVITGGATGIGRAAAKRFIEEGAFVFIFGRRQEALDAAVAALGANARAVQGSVSDLADLDRLYAAVKAERGTLDIVFANAGAGSQLPLGVDLAERKLASRPGIGKDDVEGSALGLHRRIESVEVGQIRDRPLHRAGVGPEGGHSGVERFLPAAEDED